MTKLYKLILIILLFRFSHCAEEANSTARDLLFVDGDPSTVVHVIFVAVFLSAIFHQLSVNQYLPISYDPIIFLCATIWALIARHSKVMYDYCYIANVPPEVFFTIYVPAIIFQTTFSIDSPALIKQLWSVLLICYGIASLTAILSGILVGFILSRPWHFLIDLAFGSLTTPISPVDLIAILQDSETYVKQSIIFLEGESTLGLAFPTTIYIIVEYCNANDTASIIKYIISIPIEIVVGYLCGKFGGVLMRKLYNEPATLASLILPLPFVLHYFAYIQVDNGEILIFVFAIIMSLERKTSLNQETDQFIQLSLKITLSVIHICNYIIAGFRLGLFILPFVEAKYYLLAIVCFLIVNLSRYLSFLIFAPLLRLVDSSITYKNLVICAVSNVKHPIVLTMSMNDWNWFMEMSKTLQLYNLMSASNFILSHLIVPLLFPKILDLLGTRKMSFAKHITMDGCLNYIEEKKSMTMVVLKTNRYLTDVNWQMVQKLTHMSNPFTKSALSEDDEHNIEAFKYKTTTTCPDCSKRLAYTPTTHEFSVIIREAYFRILKAEQVTYYRLYENGTLSATALHHLLQMIENNSTKAIPVVEAKEIEKLFKKGGVVNKFFRKFLNNLYNSIAEDIKPPRRPYRRYCYNIVIHPCFEPIVSFLIIVNVSLNIYDFVASELNYHYLILILSLEAVALIFFSAELLLRIFAYSFISIWDDGVKRFFARMWNRIDFAVLIMMYIGVTIDTAHYILSLHSLNVIAQIIQFFQILRLLRLARILKPFLPAMVRYFDWRIDQNIAFAYDVGKGYVTAKMEVMSLLSHIVEDVKSRVEIISNLEKNRVEVSQLLNVSQNERPWIAITVKTKEAIQLVLNTIKDTTVSLKASGWIDDFDYKMLLNSIGERNKFFATIKTIKPSAPEDILKEVAWISVDLKLVKFVLKHAKAKHLQPGDIVFENGQVADGIVIVLTGLLSVSYKPEVIVLENFRLNGILPVVDFSSPSTDIFTEYQDFIVSGLCSGELSFLTSRKMNCTVKAETYCSLFHLKRSFLMKACEMDSDYISGLRCRIWRQVALNFTSQTLINAPPYKAAPKDKIQAVLERAFVPNLKNFKIFNRCEMIEDLILVEGVITDESSKEYFVAPCYIPRNIERFEIVHLDGLETQILIVANKDINVYDVMMRVEKLSELVSRKPQDMLKHNAKKIASDLKKTEDQIFLDLTYKSDAISDSYRSSIVSRSDATASRFERFKHLQEE